jgi:hypothetical protein
LDAQTPAAEQPAEQPADEFAIIEVFGHRRHVGRILEVERFGAKLLRVDIPKDGKFDLGYTSHFYGGAAIFSMTPCDLATVERANKPYQPAGRITYSEPDEDDEIDPDPDEDDGPLSTGPEFNEASPADDEVVF